jgi:hypothetical protein
MTGKRGNPGRAKAADPRHRMPCSGARYYCCLGAPAASALSSSNPWKTSIAGTRQRVNPPPSRRPRDAQKASTSGLMQSRMSAAVDWTRLWKKKMPSWSALVQFAGLPLPVLLGPQIGLDTHVSDIVGVLRCRDLNGVVLVGHSYGGMVITAVAEQLPARIRCLVYLDASVPRDRESNGAVIGPEMAAQLRSATKSGGEGWRVPPPPYVVSRLPNAIQPWVEDRLTPHPLRCFDEPVQVRSSAAALPPAFIRSSTQSALYAGLLDRARVAGWYSRDLKGGHYPMFTEPQAVAAALAELPA